MNIHLIYYKIEAFCRNSSVKILPIAFNSLNNFRLTLFGGRFTFVSFEEAVGWAKDWANSLGDDYDVIIGIPRCGLLLASLIALRLGKPLATPDLFVKGEVWNHGNVKRFKKGTIRKALVMDDSIHTGKSMKKTIKLLNAYDKNLKIIKAALIITNASKKLINSYYKTISLPRLFEWEILQTKTGKTAIELNGVIHNKLKGDFTSSPNLYCQLLKKVKPSFIPPFEVDVLFGYGTKNDQDQIENWLKTHNVRYKKLFLYDPSSEPESNYTYYKISKILNEGVSFFYETNFFEARRLHRITKIPVICFEKRYLFR